MRVRDRVVGEEVRVGKLPERRRERGVHVQDVGGGGGEDVRIHRDGSVREIVWRRPWIRRNLVRRLPRAGVHRPPLLPVVLPELP